MVWIWRSCIYVCTYCFLIYRGYTAKLDELLLWNVSLFEVPDPQFQIVTQHRSQLVHGQFRSSNR